MKGDEKKSQVQAKRQSKERKRKQKKEKAFKYYICIYRCRCCHDYYFLVMTLFKLNSQPAGRVRMWFPSWYWINSPVQRRIPNNRTAEATHQRPLQVLLYITTSISTRTTAIISIRVRFWQRRLPLDRPRPWFPHHKTLPPTQTSSTSPAFRMV